MAGKELKATEKTVLKHSREGVLEQNLVDGSAKKVSKKAEEAVLKVATADDERFNKLKAAGLVVEDVKKPDHRKLKFGRNNPENTWAEAVYGNKPSEITVPLSQGESANLEHSNLGGESFAPNANRRFSMEISEKYEISETSIPVSYEELAEMERIQLKSEEIADSKLKNGRTRNSLKEHSAAADKLSEKSDNTALKCESKAPTEQSSTQGEKRLAKRIRRDEKKVYKLHKRLDKAEDKLPNQRVFYVRKVWKSDKQKMQRKLKLEKEVKPLPKPNIVQKGVQGAKHAVSLTVSGAVHQQISKYEDDNQTLKAAHGTEKVAESALRFASNKVKATNQKLKEKPYKKASKLKFDTENAHKKLNQHKVALEHKTEQQTKKEAKKALKKAQQKQNQKNAAKTAKKGASKAGKKAGEAAKDVSQIIVKAVTNNKVVIIILVIFLLLFGLLFTLGSSGFSSLADTGGMVIASSYTSDEEDIYAAENYMVSLENNLTNEINNIPNVYVDWNEYNYYLDPIQHDPYALISYLTAMEINFDYDADTQAKIQEIFNALYTLEVESIHEVRSYQYIEYDENGNEVLVTVYYDYYILNVTLTANDWDSVVIPKLQAAGVYDVYQLLQETHGNKPNLFQGGDKLPTPLEKTEALLEKATTDLENIRAKKMDILEKEKQAIARVNSLESTRILQLVNMSKIDSSQLKALLMAEQPKPVEQVVKPETTNFVTERITEDEEDE